MTQFLNQLRVLFPRWNFFDQLGHRFNLKYRTDEKTSWILIKFRSQWNLLNFFCNPTHNLTLAQISAIELFAQDTQNLSSFQIIKSLVEEEAKSKSFQFMVEAQKDDAIIEIYKSAWLQKEPQ